MHLPHLAEDPRYRTRPQRTLAFDVLAPVFDAVFATGTIEQWTALLTEAGIPCGPVNLNPLDVIGHPQLWANEMLVETSHPSKGPMVHTGLPVRLSDTPGRVGSASPLRGQHTDEVLREVGYTAAEITALRAKGAVG